MNNSIQRRRERYFKLSSQIAQIDNARMRSMFEESETTEGWAKNHTLEIAGSKIFVKRIPVTDLEVENMFSTRNFYELPVYYNYGVGSAGFGVFRELVAHVKTTNWVLEGAVANFPLAYHYRIIPFSGKRAEVDMEHHQRYVEYWGGHPNIGRYILDRASASHELVLFLEHMPYTLGPWLGDHPDKACRVLEDLRTAIGFLKKNGIIHFDVHFWNVVTEGERAYLTDFGLVLDKSFALSPEEQSFFQRNSYYDYGEALSSFGYHAARLYEALSEADKCRLRDRYGIKDGIPHDELVSLLINHLEEISAGRLMQIDESYAAGVVKYRGIILLMHGFYSEICANKKKDTKLRHAELRRLLKETGFVPGSEPSSRARPRQE